MLSGDETTMTEIDAAILWGLAKRHARAVPRFFEELRGSPSSNPEIRRRMGRAQDLHCALWMADRGAERAAHVADCQHVATLDRLIRADWLPSRAVEYLED
jgi:hypothetical protein